MIRNNETFIFLGARDVPEELNAVMERWYELSRQTGDHGSCVLGAGFRFIYRGISYFMSACSPWQGSLSWEEHTETIQADLERLGCRDIRYDWGRMD